MTASFMGHVDIVRALIEAKAQVNKLDKVWLLLPPENTLHNTSSYTVLLYNILFVFLSTGWLDCSSPGNSRRQG